MSSVEWITTSVPYLTARQPGQRDAWSAETAAKGRRGSQRIVQAGEVAAPDEIAQALGVGRGETVVVRRRIMYLDDRPCELTDTYYPSAIARGTRLAGTAKIPGGAVTLLAELGYVGVRSREDISARLPSEDEAEALESEVTQPVLQLIRLTLDARERPIQADRMVMPSRLQHLRYEMRIG
ncbi:UTRA domain-containing protein [Streptomyces sp. 2224.1]|uniref:GntR family transcriptional regulator n=1 Tax=unclassified Streptomyces TaxID=2593676 RepID=UPI0008859C33|nr:MULTISPECIES: UTRA domain-containing protein [unclassified Streptomyces]PBC82600.1 UTRA domain-containing protein [Streptomyces sp. 2321.6]SDR48592.1 UTRA domain-containing protein [Streptomyces sp. KS_16]SEC40554.1 UTRA domain-containing protein [Streptomyces sp. 2224.1]SEC64404.1 UTRA domain-containing protein [Streptomyces sp. 2133.1]SEE95198.1 UTRA domain-containing protein [Streptomyces sp. 2112.3]